MQRNTSTEDQARNCTRRIEGEGWQLVAHYKDEGISGARFNRPGYQTMLKAAQGREFDVLVVDDLSRFSRDQDWLGTAILGNALYRGEYLWTQRAG